MECYNELQELINTFMITSHKIEEKLYECITAPNKNFIVTFKEVTYDLSPESDPTLLEYYKQYIESFCEKLIKETLKDFAENINTEQELTVFDNILAFTQGVDVRDHQFEKVTELSNEEVGKEEKGKKAVPLNLGSIYIKWQNPKTIL